MAASGLLLTAFAAIHAWGNTKLFLGEEHFNAYARFLREVGTPLFPHSGLLWLTRIALLLAADRRVRRLSRRAPQEAGAPFSWTARDGAE